MNARTVRIIQKPSNNQKSKSTGKNSIQKPILDGKPKYQVHVHDTHCLAVFALKKKRESNMSHVAVDHELGSESVTLY